MPSFPHTLLLAATLGIFVIGTKLIHSTQSPLLDLFLSFQAGSSKSCCRHEGELAAAALVPGVRKTLPAAISVCRWTHRDDPCGLGKHTDKGLGNLLSRKMEVSSLLRKVTNPSQYSHRCVYFFRHRCLALNQILFSCWYEMEQVSHTSIHKL